MIGDLLFVKQTAKRRSWYGKAIHFVQRIRMLPGGRARLIHVALQQTSSLAIEMTGRGLESSSLSSLGEFVKLRPPNSVGREQKVEAVRRTFEASIGKVYGWLQAGAIGVYRLTGIRLPFTADWICTEQGAVYVNFLPLPYKLDQNIFSVDELFHYLKMKGWIEVPAGTY